MDPSDRFAEILPCGCEWHAGQLFHCAEHFRALGDLTRHSDHKTYASNCDRCQGALQEARELEGQAPWNDQ